MQQAADQHVEDSLDAASSNVLFQEACRSSYFGINLPRTQVQQLQYNVWQCVPHYWPYHVTANKGLRSKGLVKFIGHDGDPKPFQMSIQPTVEGLAVFELLVLSKMARRQAPLDEVLSKMRYERMIYPKTWEKYLEPWLRNIGYELEPTMAAFKEKFGSSGR